MSHAHQIRLFCSCVLLAAGDPGHSSIFGRDDRLYVSTAPGSPYSPVGVVSSGFFGKRATGVLVDKCHVLTVQAVAGYGQSVIGKRLTFKAAIGTRQQVATYGRVIAVGGATLIRTGEEQARLGGRDWLLLRLDECVGATLGYASLKVGPFFPTDFRNLQSAGYPLGRDGKLGLTVDPSCRFTASNGTLWLNDCSVQRGDAGGPIFRIVASEGKAHMEVYALQVRGYPNRAPVPLKPGNENEAVPVSLIASQIRPFLLASARTPRSDTVVSAAKHPNAIPHVRASADVSSYRRLLDPRLEATYRGTDAYGGTQ